MELDRAACLRCWTDSLTRMLHVFEKQKIIQFALRWTHAQQTTRLENNEITSARQAKPPAKTGTYTPFWSVALQIRGPKLVCRHKRRMPSLRTSSFRYPLHKGYNWAVKNGRKRSWSHTEMNRRRQAVHGERNRNANSYGIVS